MILRLIRARTARAGLEALREALDRTLGPEAGETAGPAHWHLGWRGDGDEVDVLIAAAWESAEAAVQGDARSISPWRIAQATVSDVRLQHFEIDASLERRTGDEPVAIRIATGRFSRHGADIEMQELLRERMSTIGDEMCEAYVGRRMDGPAIEVTFVSLWERWPDGWQLETPLWPDIALRYDAFSVEVYQSIR